MAEMRRNLPHLVFHQYGYFTDSELRIMHRNLGDITFNKRMAFIENTKLDDVPQNKRQQLKDIIGRCKTCQLLRAKPHQFLFSIKDDVTAEFNHVLQVDIMHLSDGNVLHILCTGTGFQQGQFVTNMSATEAWKVLTRIWINTYSGAANKIETDSGSNFTATELMEAAKSSGICI